MKSQIAHQKHTIIYYGNYYLNYERLVVFPKSRLKSFRIRKSPESRKKSGGQEYIRVSDPSREATGIVFGYMELPKKNFCAVLVEDVVLNKPILLSNHPGVKGFGPKASRFGDQPAKELLEDCIHNNPGQQNRLVNIYNIYFGPPSLLNKTREQEKQDSMYLTRSQLLGILENLSKCDKRNDSESKNIRANLRAHQFYLTAFKKSRNLQTNDLSLIQKTINNDKSFEIDYHANVFLKQNGDSISWQPLPEEIDEDTSYPEGAKRVVTVNAYERNRNARKACIRHHGHQCVVCNFSFEEHYGNIGRDHIEVHHLKPLPEIGHNYAVDPIKDLRPVCPNCHSVIHLRKPPYGIEEVKRMIRRSK